MWKGFFVCEVISVAFHRKPKTLSQNIVSGSGSLFGSFNIELVGLVCYRLSEVGIGLKPHLGVGYLVNGIEFVPPNRYVGIVVVSLKDAHQLHFDCVAASVTNSTLRRGCDDEIVVNLGCTLFDGTYYILSNVSREPLINGSDFTSQTLKLIDAHWSDFKQGASKEVLNSFLGCC